jgi:hypothetical protein
MRLPSQELMRQIREAVRLVLGEYRNSLPAASGYGSAQTRVYIAKAPAGGIPAMTEGGGTYTPGTAICTLYYINSSGNLAEHQDEGSKAVTETVYNLSSVAVAADQFIHIKQELLSGRLLVDFDPC